MLASLALLTGCEKDDDPTSVSLRSITREKFDYKGGLASAIVDAGGRDVTAESSESWCRTAVIGSIVNFNVLAYTGSEERSATVTVKAEGLKPLLINVVQDKFRGLVVVPSTLIFSDTDRIRSLEQRIGHKNASFFLNCTRKKGDVKELSEEKAKGGRAWRVGRQRVMGRKAEERGCKNASEEGERGLNRSF